jgi:hypothetical protein
MKWTKEDHAKFWSGIVTALTVFLLFATVAHETGLATAFVLVAILWKVYKIDAASIVILSMMIDDGEPSDNQEYQNWLRTK